MARWVFTLTLLLSLLGSNVFAEADDPSWRTVLTARVRAGEPIVVHVTVALCDNAQIACGSGGLGSPGNLRSNLYWGALFGAKRFFDRPEQGWEAIEQRREIGGVLERAVYRRWVDGSRWGRRRRVEQLVVLDAVHGARIDAAVKRFHRMATVGARVGLDDGEQRRNVTVSVAGYAGHNRLMDGLRLPEVEDGDRAPVPSFVLACLSDRFFASSLRQAGSTPVVTTRAFMAPEGYAVEAAARAFGDNRRPKQIRDAVVRAYAKWQRITPRAASRLFE
ncbi:MAG: hypothetical protein RIF41_38890 [Polyangiaceae bacterium]